MSYLTDPTTWELLIIFIVLFGVNFLRKMARPSELPSQAIKRVKRKITKNNQPINSKASSNTSPIARPRQYLNVVSYNVFLGEDELFSKERHAHVLSTIMHESPDIICLQEASDQILKMINNNHFYYHCQVGQHIILSKYQIIDSYQLYAYGSFDDNILCAVLDCVERFGFNIIVYNVHLSGGTYDKTDTQILERRIRRILELNRLNKHISCSMAEYGILIMGDFNSDANSPDVDIAQYKHKDSCDPEIVFYPNKQCNNIVDVWTEVASTAGGYTEDTELNLFRRHLKKGQSRRARYDQIYYHRNNMQATQVRLIGTKQIDKIDNIDIFPSDHFGLSATFEIE